MTQQKSGALAHLEEQVSSALDTFYEKIGKHHHGVSGPVACDFHPAADLTRRDKGLELTLEVPGLDAAALEVEAGEGWLAVRGHKEQEYETGNERFLVRERHFGTFERRFAMPGDVDPHRARATFEDGVLTIVVPMRPGARRAARRIEIKAG